MISLFRRINEYELYLLSYLQPYLLLALRSYWGFQFFMTGCGKLMSIALTAEYFNSLHIPQPLINAYIAGGTECFGGLLLIIGFSSRIVAIPLIVTMLVAYGTAHTQALTGVFQNPDAFVAAPPFLFLLVSTIVLVFGPGWISVDGLIQHFVFHKCPRTLRRHSECDPA
jgi:putative oxidoreductase